MTNSYPSMTFYRIIESARMPQRADRSACGTLPIRAVRYCEALCSAAAFGWWAFTPIDLGLVWDGSDIFWSHPRANSWLPLDRSAQCPGLSYSFNETAPADLRGCAPPLVTALPEPGTVQLWTGLMIRTRPNWHALVRAPANLPLPGGYNLYEGIISSDTWFGPLFTNLRLMRTGSPIWMKADFPLVQIQAIPSEVYSDAVLSDVTVIPSMAALSPEDWANYRKNIATPNTDRNRAFGRYARQARKAMSGDATPNRSPVAKIVA